MTISHHLDPSTSVLLLGCGKMGNSMLRGWLARGLTNCVVVDPTKPAIPSSHVPVVAKLEDVPKEFVPNIVVLAIKPGQVAGLARQLRPQVHNATILSIIAGASLESYAELFGKDQPCIRAMPNMPAAIGHGITVCVANKYVSVEHKQLCDQLLKSIGLTIWLENESLMDVVTAISGSGPAYVFYLAELMEHIGRDMGLPAELARTLARQTVSGSGAMLAASKDDSARLRESITSPNGTTQSALNVLMHRDAMPEILKNAIIAATERSRQLVPKPLKDMQRG